ncbi:MAG: hypothetical protein ACFE0S_10225 [Rhodospirillales bacterium]
MREIEDKVEQFFAGTWSPLESTIGSTPIEPGVYALSFTHEDLTKEAIDCRRIDYVGMSRSQGGVRSRLKQFLRGVRVGEGHSAGNRFNREGAVQLGLAQTEKLSEAKFWVSCLAISCEVEKGLRNADDLRKIGHVECLEKYILAYFYERMGHEPKLNKQ